MSAYIDNVKLLLFMSENIGKLTTPSGDGVSVIVRDTDIIIDNNLLINNKTICKNINTSDLTIVGATTNHGAALVLSGSEKNTDECGSFQLAAQAIEPNEFTNNNGRIWLSGKTNNELRWNNKLIDTIYSSGDKYIQYTNGLLLQWGEFTSQTNSVTSINFYIPYITFPTLLAQVTGTGNSGHYTIRTTPETAYFNFITINPDGVIDFGIGFKWFAIGRWK